MKTNPHSELVNEIILALGSRPDIRVWKNSTGTARTMVGNVVSFGLKGSSDIIGIMQGGRFLCVEIKTGNAIQSKEQKNFETMIRKFGGIYILARSVKDATDGVSYQSELKGANPQR